MNNMKVAKKGNFIYNILSVNRGSFHLMISHGEVL
jgi:hypothetical protein